MSHTIKDTEEWHLFFEQYKDLPELGQIKNDAFKNREKKKKKAWSVLLRLYQCIVPNATVEQLKSRINNIRTCFRRELKRIIESEKSGAGADDIHVPSLWYYDHLNFLRDQEEVAPSTSTMDSCDEEDVELPRPPKRKPKSTPKDTREEFMAKAIEHLDARSKTTKDIESVKDEAAIFADAWAVRFRKLSTHQQLCAKKAIDDIILLPE